MPRPPWETMIDPRVMAGDPPPWETESSYIAPNGDMAPGLAAPAFGDPSSGLRPGWDDGTVPSTTPEEDPNGVIPGSGWPGSFAPGRPLTQQEMASAEADTNAFLAEAEAAKKNRGAATGAGQQGAGQPQRGGGGGGYGVTVKEKVPGKDPGYTAGPSGAGEGAMMASTGRVATAAEATREAGAAETAGAAKAAEGEAEAARQYIAGTTAGEQAMKEAKAQTDAKMQQIAADAEAYRNAKVDPNRYWKDQSGTQKVASAIGLFLGGFLEPVTGKNTALEIINNAIERDIAAQRDDLMRQGEGIKMKADLASQEWARSASVAEFDARMLFNKKMATAEMFRAEGAKLASPVYAEKANAGAAMMEASALSDLGKYQQSEAKRVADEKIAGIHARAAMINANSSSREVSLREQQYTDAKNAAAAESANAEDFLGVPDVQIDGKTWVPRVKGAPPAVAAKIVDERRTSIGAKKEAINIVHEMKKINDEAVKEYGQKDWWTADRSNKYRRRLGQLSGRLKVVFARTQGGMGKMTKQDMDIFTDTMATEPGGILSTAIPYYSKDKDASQVLADMEGDFVLDGTREVKSYMSDEDRAKVGKDWVWDVPRDMTFESVYAGGTPTYSGEYLDKMSASERAAKADEAIGSIRSPGSEGTAPAGIRQAPTDPSRSTVIGDEYTGPGELPSWR